jgi:DNA-binding response OmpR family regulator
MHRILIIEDDDAIRMGLEDDLKLEGYEILAAACGDQGLAYAQTGIPDLIILDIMLPGLDGFTVCQALRTSGNTVPILVLTAKSGEVDKVLGLELGADDYMTKPFSPRELLSRVKALLRRANLASPETIACHINDVEIDFRSHVVRKSGHPVPLSALEFDLLHFFVNRPDEVLTRDVILDGVWGKDVYVTSRTVDTHVAHLRQKLEDDPTHPRTLVGVRGIGYKFVVHAVNNSRNGIESP